MTRTGGRAPDYADIGAEWTLDRAGQSRQIWADLDGDESLVFRSKDVYTELLVDEAVMSADAAMYANKSFLKSKVV